ncbi:Adenosylmethionine-8-amino-7-oxononanoate aminotransferase [compost metagenome]
MRERGQQLEALLHQTFDDHPHVGDIRGRGLFWGVELVANRDNKQWFDPARKLHARIKSEAMAAGLMVYPMGGTVDGRCGDHVLLAPPFISTPQELEQIVGRLAGAIDRAVAA